MKHLLFVALVAATFAITGCSTVTDIFGSDAAKFLTDAREKGVEIGDDVLDGTATAFDAYCGATPETVKEFLRMSINARTAAYDIGEFCVPKDVPPDEAS